MDTKMRAVVSMNNCLNYIADDAIIHPDNFAKLDNKISEIIDIII